MKVIERATMPNGTAIQIENWNEDYPNVFASCSTLAAYPISKASHKGSFSPKHNQKFRAQFDFTSYDEAKQALDSLVSGKNLLADYASHLDSQEYADCI
jgi:hypothetical protein